MANLIGKVALITGASRGIGAAIALQMARDGADVAITYISRPEAASSTLGALTRSELVCPAWQATR
jgi:3-oxoacyl-[acyl-carrier protein] reductase